MVDGTSRPRLYSSDPIFWLAILHRWGKSEDMAELLNEKWKVKREKAIAELAIYFSTTKVVVETNSAVSGSWPLIHLIWDCRDVAGRKQADLFIGLCGRTHRRDHPTSIYPKLGPTVCRWSYSTCACSTRTQVAAPYTAPLNMFGPAPTIPFVYHVA